MPASEVRGGRPPAPVLAAIAAQSPRSGGVTREGAIRADPGVVQRHRDAPDWAAERPAHVDGADETGHGLALQAPAPPAYCSRGHVVGNRHTVALAHRERAHVAASAQTAKARRRPAGEPIRSHPSVGPARPGTTPPAEGP